MDHTKELIENAHNGDKNARDQLILENMGLIWSIVKRFLNRGYEQEDLFQVGSIGLIKAVDSFKPDKNIKFATYAAKCIDNEILMMLRSEKKKIREVSIYEPIGTDKEGNEISIIEIVGDDTEDVVEAHIRKQRVECLKKNMDKVLTKREKMIIIKRYGLFESDEMTQSELAKTLGISRSYVSRIEKKALGKLKNLLRDNKL